MTYYEIPTPSVDFRELLRTRLGDSMRSAHSSGDTVSSPTDAAEYAIDYLLTEEGSLLLRAVQVVERARSFPGVIVINQNFDSDD